MPGNGKGLRVRQAPRTIEEILTPEVLEELGAPWVCGSDGVFSHAGAREVYLPGVLHPMLVEVLVFAVNSAHAKHTRAPAAFPCVDCGGPVVDDSGCPTCLPYGVQEIATKRTVWFRNLDVAWSVMGDGMRMVTR